MNADNPITDYAHPARVLLVEDEPAARKASGLFLRRFGFDVATAASASEAIEAADRATPDLLICDWRLGSGRDGVDVARELQGRFGTPVIFVSAHPLDELRAATEDLNVAQYMRKPISLDDLVAAISNLT